MPTDDDDERESNPILDAAENFLSAFGTGDEWRQAVDEMTEGTNIDPEQAITAGITAGEKAARARQQSRAVREREPEQDAPSLRTRDIEGEDGRYLGTRVTCSDPTAEVYHMGSAALIRAGPYDAEITVPAEIAEVEAVETGEGAAEWVLRPAPHDDDTTDAADVEGGDEDE